MADKKTITKNKVDSSKTSEKVKKEVKKSTENVTKEDSTNSKKPTANPEHITKAGKHSKKAIIEAEAKAKKEERKKITKNTEEEVKPKVIIKPRVIKYSKNQKAARELVNSNKLYELKEALELLPKLSKTKFDATAEVHVSLSIDTKQSEQNLRTSAALPAGSGKSVKVAVIASDKDSQAAKKAGADSTNAQDILAEIQKGKLDFDVLIATPEKMADLGRHAKVLGPKGLMPSPKSGTVTNNPAAMVEEIKRGRAEIKNDSSGIVHVPFGKLSFKTVDLENNLRAILSAIKTNKPNGVKGTYIKSIYVTSSMSPSIKLDPEAAFKATK